MLDTTHIKGYELLERIGSGGFGVVHRAYQSTVGREVAVKVILPHFAHHPDFIRRFEAEAQLIARLEHLHIVPLYDFWRDQTGAFLVMRWLRGGSLRDALRKGPFDLEAAALLLDQIGSALAAAHRSDVVHRDLKPANILFDEDGNAYLADFGIAQDLRRPSPPDDGDLTGSPDYIAPEQARREPVTPRTDIYSLGVVLYEMLAGQHPFPGANAVERLYHHLNDPLPPLTNLPDDVVEDVNAVIAKVTAKDPARRYGDPLALAAAFHTAAAIQRPLADGSLVEQLTLREHEILQLILDGSTNQEIAQQLVVTVATVKWHVRHLYRKLGVRSRVQAIVRAREMELIGAEGDVEPSSVATFAALPEPHNPYKGLQAFQTTDARDFFGREALVTKLVARLAEPHKIARFLAVVGPSGSGKSSLVKAGLVPALWRGDLPGSDRWFVVEMMPGARPLDELEIALEQIAADHSDHLHEQLERDANGLLRVAGLILPPDNSELVLIIDQFEEVFTLVEQEAARTHFLDLLHAAVTDRRSRVRVILTLRADFYDRPLHYPAFGELVRQRMETVLPLSAEELEAAMVKPAARVGVLFEEGLVPTIIAEVNYQPGALPLLQYALTELFERREARTLTRDAYVAIGGAIGALARRAEELYREQEGQGQETIRQLFLRLVTLGEGTQDTRRRVHLSELRQVAADADLLDEIVDAFAAYRLLSLDRDPATRSPTVEVAHEALLQQWERLREWLNLSRDDVRLQRQLAAQAAEWSTAQRDASYLLRGSRLKQFERWLAETELALTPGERAYLEASVAEHDRQALLEQQRQAREVHLQRRAQRILQGLVAVFLVAAVAGIALASFAFDREQQAEDARATSEVNLARAEREANVNRSLVLANNAEAAVAKGKTDLGMLLALEAVRLDDPPANAIAALESVALSFGKRAILREGGGPVLALTFSPDSSLALSAGCADEIDWVCSESDLVVWDIRNQVQLRRLEGPVDWATDVAFVDDVTAVASYNDGSLLLWDIANAQVIRRYEGHVGSVERIAISPDARLLASGGADTIVRVWDVQSGELLHEFDDHMEKIRAVAFSPDGNLLAAGADDELIDVWEMGTWRHVQRLAGHTTTIGGLVFRPGSSGALPRLVSAARTDLREWDLETSQTLRSYQMHCASFDLAISPDGRALATIGCNAVDLYDLDDWRFAADADGLSDMLSLAISPDGRYLLGGGYEGHIELYNMPDSGEIREFKAEVPLMAASVSPDGRYLLTGAYTGGVAILWDTQTGEEVWRLGNQVDAVLVVNISPDGQQAVIGSSDPWGDTRDGLVVLVDLVTGQVMHALEGHEFGLRDAAFSPDGGLLLTGSLMFGAGYEDHAPCLCGELILWDAHTGEMIRRFEATQAVFDVAFSPDGKTAYTSTLNPTTSIAWDVATGKKIAEYPGAIGVRPGVEPNTLVSDINLIDLETGQIIRRFQGGHLGDIMLVDVSPDGRYLLTGDTTGRLILWNYATGEIVRYFTGHTTTIWSAFFSPDGQTAYSSAYEYAVRQWRVADWPLADLLEWIAKNRYLRDFTCDEREEYQIEPLCR